MKILLKRPEIVDISFCSTIYRNDIIMAGLSSRDIAKDIVKVRSSNVWGYTINVRDKDYEYGDVYVQFKSDKGGPGDIYVYYDVPTKLFQRWHTAPSKGHFFWQYIRNNFVYAKLTGDKKTHLKNGVRTPA